MKRYLLIFLLAAGLLAGCGRTGSDSGPAPEQKSGGSAPHAAADSRPVIDAFGDSLTAGLGVDPTQNYPSKLQALIDAAGYRYRVVNSGISGDTTAQGLSRISAVLALHPKIVILELGANDGLRGMPLSETRRNLEEIIIRLQKSGAAIVLAGMEMPPNYGAEYTSGFRQIFVGLAQEYHTALIPFFLAGVGGHPELNREDGIHPTAKGYDIVTENVWRVLKPLLRKGTT